MGKFDGQRARNSIISRYLSRLLAGDWLPDVRLRSIVTGSYYCWPAKGHLPSKKHIDSRRENKSQSLLITLQIFCLFECGFRLTICVGYTERNLS